ncbi:hypothetical protein MRX96_000183 [Rhipicephalus microplus]
MCGDGVRMTAKFRSGRVRRLSVVSKVGLGHRSNLRPPRGRKTIFSSLNERGALVEPFWVTCHPGPRSRNASKKQTLAGLPMDNISVNDDTAIPLTYYAVASTSATNTAQGGRTPRQPDYWAPEGRIFSASASTRAPEATSAQLTWKGPAVPQTLLGPFGLWDPPPSSGQGDPVLPVLDLLLGLDLDMDAVVVNVKRHLSFA